LFGLGKVIHFDIVLEAERLTTQVELAESFNVLIDFTSSS